MSSTYVRKYSVHTHDTVRVQVLTYEDLRHDTVEASLHRTGVPKAR